MTQVEQPDFVIVVGVKAGKVVKLDWSDALLNGHRDVSEPQIRQFIKDAADFGKDF